MSTEQLSNAQELMEETVDRSTNKDFEESPKNKKLVRKLVPAQPAQPDAEDDDNGN